MGTSESDQYVLVHHEYAGLAGIEISKGEDSDYQVSNQISGYLENQVIKKLAVKPSNAEVTPLPSNVRVSGIDWVHTPALKYSCLEKIEHEQCSSDDQSHEGIAEVNASCEVWTSFAYIFPDGSRSSMRYRLELSTYVGSNGLDILGSIFTMGLAQIITSPAKQAYALSRVKSGFPALMSQLSDTMESKGIGLCNDFVNYSSNSLPTPSAAIHRPDTSGLCRTTTSATIYTAPSSYAESLTHNWAGAVLYDTGVREDRGYTVFAKVQVLVPNNGVDHYPPDSPGWINVNYTDCAATQNR